MNVNFLNAVIFDWAGTMVDHGSRAPAIVFQEIFRQRGVQITEAQAREPMGMAKRAHISAIAHLPEIAEAWERSYSKRPDDSDIDAMYADFLPLQKKTLADHCQLIEGAAEMAADCRRRGLKIGSSTGYTRELMDVVSAAAAEQGYKPDCVLCAEDANLGRPAPFLIYEAARRMEVFPMWSIVKVDDTPVGIKAGRNAGCWTVGITLTGNCVGKSVSELDALDDSEKEGLHEQAAKVLRDAGAHFVIRRVADILPVLDEIEKRIANSSRHPGTLPLED